MPTPRPSSALAPGAVAAHRRLSAPGGLAPRPRLAVRAIGRPRTPVAPRAGQAPRPGSPAALFAALVAVLALAGCGATRASAPSEPRPVVATSLLGEPLRAPAIAPERRARLEADLAAARDAYASHPRSEEAAIWYGRRLAYLGRYAEAIEVWTRALVWHPRSSKLLRHRGHRWITLREIDRAVADLEDAAALLAGTADELEPDGAPNARALPRSTHHSNVGYHLGLARWLRGDARGALDAWRATLGPAAATDDMLCATLHWTTTALRRLGRDAEARALLADVRADMDVIENRDYHRLLLLYRGELAPADVLAAAEGGVAFASAAYGVGAWHLDRGERERAHELFRAILATDAWPAFGYLAAEAELARATTHPPGPDATAR